MLFVLSGCLQGGSWLYSGKRLTPNCTSGITVPHVVLLLPSRLAVRLTWLLKSLFYFASLHWFPPFAVKNSLNTTPPPPTPPRPTPLVDGGINDRLWYLVLVLADSRYPRENLGLKGRRRFPRKQWWKETFLGTIDEEINGSLVDLNESLSVIRVRPSYA